MHIFQALQIKFLMICLYTKMACYNCQNLELKFSFSALHLNPSFDINKCNFFPLVTVTLNNFGIDWLPRND